VSFGRTDRAVLGHIGESFFASFMGRMHQSAALAHPHPGPLGPLSTTSLVQQQLAPLNPWQLTPAEYEPHRSRSEPPSGSEMGGPEIGVPRPQFKPNSTGLFSNDQCQRSTATPDLDRAWSPS
jgi:hypothetical protein